jgi:hypothetical protein
VNVIIPSIPFIIISIEWQVEDKKEATQLP